MKAKPARIDELARLSRLLNFIQTLQKQRSLDRAASFVLSELAPLVNMHCGTFYINEANNGDVSLRLLAGYALKKPADAAARCRAGEGLVGQCALEKQRILLTDIPDGYLEITSGLGASKPANIVVLPVLFEGRVKAVIEVASFSRFSESHLTFLDELTEGIGAVIDAISAAARMEQLLKQSQTLAEELQARQAELKRQQEEFQRTNEELAEKANLLAKRNLEVERKNQEIEAASRALQDTAEQLAVSSKYKSEFLANMSHELRTPLNSMLILSSLLAEAGDSLSEKQREYARTIHSAGSELLDLINDILDLSKIESGLMEVEIDRVQLPELRDYVELAFRQTARDKGILFEIILEEDAPPVLYTDQRRLQQILRNLLANAFKFTERGSVTLRIGTAREGWRRGHDVLDSAAGVVRFVVADTGIGISPDKHKIIFEAFQQADGTISRKFGGTGLGLSISRELSRLLGGEIQLESSFDNGSTFTLFLPYAFNPSARLEQPAATGVRAEPEKIARDDREEIKPADKTLLIVEDDMQLAAAMMEAARARGLKVLAANSGDAGYALARQFVPSAIALDVDVPGVNGWTVLDRLKHQPSTRHIPVHVITYDEDRRRGLRMGAAGHIPKPALRRDVEEAFTRIQSTMERRVKNLLLIHGDDALRSAIIDVIQDADVHITAARTAQEAVEELGKTRYDCVILPPRLGDVHGFDLVERIKTKGGDVPIIVYSDQELTPGDATELQRLVQTTTIKHVGSLGSLLNETALFLHRIEQDLPEPKRRLIQQSQRDDPILTGKTALIIDDDMRNVFAVTCLLERYGMQVLYAENGKDGIDILANTPHVDVVLVDIMMPEMDGYETMRRIRSSAPHKHLPLIALTAKAMKGDREKCMESGASDYVTKPADSDQLLSLLRVSLSR